MSKKGDKERDPKKNKDSEDLGVELTDFKKKDKILSFLESEENLSIMLTKYGAFKSIQDGIKEIENMIKELKEENNEMEKYRQETASRTSLNPSSFSGSFLSQNSTATSSNSSSTVLGPEPQIIQKKDHN